jgi:hypothetical protein
MEKIMSHIIVFLVLTLGSFQAISQNRWTLEFLPGYAGVLPSNLSVWQSGEKVADFTAKWDTRSFESPIYYSYRLGYVNKNGGWEIEMNHLKVYLTNTNSVVSRFSISHGYNQVWVNRVMGLPFGSLRVGLGPVVSHEENTVNGFPLSEKGGLFNDGYHFSGISSQVAWQKRFWIGNYFFLSGEAKISAAYAKIKVYDGFARVPMAGYHILLGAGFAL